MNIREYALQPICFTADIVLLSLLSLDIYVNMVIGQTLHRKFKNHPEKADTEAILTGTPIQVHTLHHCQYIAALTKFWQNAAAAVPLLT